MTRLRSWIGRQPDFVFIVIATLAAFSTYSCMYAFRKPFTATGFDGMSFWGVDYKILLITSQVIGYTLSKFIGIKVVSEMSNERRAPAILLYILLAGISLFFFALVPAPANIIFLFLNGLPLGMVWGLVFSYLEGRRYTEVLGAGLCVTFIISSGFVKSVGSFVMLEWNTSEFWMPLVTGLLFVIPLFISVWLLDQIPPPDQRDVRARTKRKPMNRMQRFAFLKRFAVGMILLVITYAFLTAFRDFRDNFAAEIWTALGYGDEPHIFTTAEVPVAIGVLVLLATLMFVRSNINALQLNFALIGLGGALVGISTLAYSQGAMNGVSWMVLTGLGSYLGYIPFNAILFDRLIAAFKYVSNVGFAIYIADAFGYLSSVGLLFYKNFGEPDLSWLEFFQRICMATSVAVVTLSVCSMLYFHFKYKNYKRHAY